VIIAITGGRDHAPEHAEVLSFWRFWRELGGTELRHGAARGVDSVIGSLAKGAGVYVRPFPVDESIDGPWPAAGYRRNWRAGARRILCEFAGRRLAANNRNSLNGTTSVPSHPTSPNRKDDPMTKLELALMLNGREMGEEISDDEEALAKASNLVVVFGASDDLTELRGAVNDEVSCIYGGSFLIDGKGLLPDERDEDWSDDEMLEYLTRKRHAAKVEALWCAPGSECSWSFKTDLDVCTFEIMESDELYCRGIVFELPPLRPE